MKMNPAFMMYNYLSSIFIIITFLLFNIGIPPFSDDIISKPWLPGGALKYVTVSSILLVQLLFFILMVYILSGQHRAKYVLYSKV